MAAGLTAAPLMRGYGVRLLIITQDLEKLAKAYPQEWEGFFGNAQIVWVDDAAYSANETTAMMIEDEDGVSTLEKIDKDAIIWVKY